MSSPSRTNDLQEEHCPSLQPCMSMIPCSAAARRIVWSSLTSISMPTGSNRTTCLSAMTPSRTTNHELRTTTCGLRLRTAGRRWGGRGLAAALPSCLLVPLGYRSAIRGRRTARGALAHIVRVEGLTLFWRLLIEQHVGAQHRAHPAQVVQRPHLLGVEVQMRLRDQRLAVVTHIAHVGYHVGPVPAVVEGLPLPLPDQLAHVRGRPALVGRPEGGDVGPGALLVAVRADLAVDLFHDHVLADEAGDHAGPAAVRG